MHALFFQVGSYDQRCRLLHNITWHPLADFPHTGGALVGTDFPTGASGSLVVYQEVIESTGQSRYEVLSDPHAVRVPSIKPDSSKPNPRIGVSLIAFSSDNRYLATRNDNQPTAVWVWDISRLSLCSLLLHEHHVRCMAWDPAQTRLAIATGTNKIYMWSPEGSLAVVMPNEAAFPIQQLQWQKDGSTMLLLSDTEMCVCFFEDDDDKEN